MKKLILMMTVSALTQTGQAKNGGADPGKLAFKNSLAGFVSESLEQSLRMLTTANTAMKDRAENASVILSSADDSTVTISFNDGSATTYTCIRMDHLSNGGTVLKKEVICQQQ